jgi:hypothetical protein
MKNISDTEDSLYDNTVKIIALLERLSSYKFTFLRGVVNGVGSFIGATIVATIVITISIQVLGYFGLSEYFTSFFPQTK